MEYVSAREKLNKMDMSGLEEELQRLKYESSLTAKERATILKATVGSLFSASKEIKAEELYRVVLNGAAPLEDYDLFWQPKNGYITFCTDPIAPFLYSEMHEGSKATLLTYRKAVSENPLGLMLEGFTENSSVFDVLEKDGLSENGKQSYIRICNFIKKELESCRPGCDFIEMVKSLLEDGAPSGAYCYSIRGAEYCAFDPEYAQTYYRCTSSIFCRLVSTEGGGDVIKIEPLMHNNCAVIPGRQIGYDDFGEVGNFTFEMADYR